MCGCVFQVNLDVGLTDQWMLCEPIFRGSCRIRISKRHDAPRGNLVHGGTRSAAMALPL